MEALSGLLGLYWGARQEPLEVCARRAYESLIKLQALGYDRYFKLGRSRRDALKREVDVTSETILATLAKGANRTDVAPRRTIPELGWSMSLWSGGADSESYSIRFHCGAYSAYVGNHVLMKLPPAGPHSIVASPEKALEAYAALVGLWTPEQAVLCEGSIRWDDKGRLVPERTPLAWQSPSESAR